ncbi:DapH/DapD/GlmU-related protein [Bradyrhizobium sp. LB11.1]|uniref:acyltransferase n=1 Tax=Bradyrhizobium sp. LB11.1 TaxID=3156326 RepID=UPI00339A0CF5
MLKILIQALFLFFPWKIRRLALNAIPGFSIHRDARVGLSLIRADECVLESKTYIGHLNYIGRLDRLQMDEDAVIGNLNWIGGLSTRLNSPAFRTKAKRRSDLIMRKASLVMSQHYIDCTDRIEFRPFCGLAGFRSQLLTHGVNPISARQTCSPITIGANTMIGTGVIILQGVTIPDNCVVASGAVVTHVAQQEYSMIGGNPAVHQRDISKNAKIFHRTVATVM